MKKFKIVIPVYNDWESLTKLLNEINKEVQGIAKVEFHCVVVDDASTIKPPEIKVPKNISTLQIISMKQNRGHARCNAFAIRHFSKNDDFDHLIVMDGDGEDDVTGAEMCKMMVALGGAGECDGSTLSMTYTDLCDETDEDEACDAATAGMVGTICMWLGIVMALVMVLMAVLPMAGVDAMDNLPDMVGMIASWAAGGLMILGVALWLLLLPDGDSDLGYSTILAVVGGLMGLGSTAMNTFMADE